MKKNDFRIWLEDRVRQQSRLLMAAAAAMAAAGFTAALIELLLIWLILNAGFVTSGFLSALLAIAVSGIILFVTWQRMPVNLCDASHSVDVAGVPLTIREAPSMSDVWTFALGSFEAERSWLERIPGLAAMPQRLICAAWYVWQRLTQLRQLDIAGAAHVIRLVYRKAERMEFSEIAEKRPETDLVRTLREVSLIDGVMFLTRKPAAISLAQRLTDELNSWKSSPESDSPDGED